MFILAFQWSDLHMQPHKPFLGLRKIMTVWHFPLGTNYVNCLFVPASLDAQTAEIQGKWEVTAHNSIDFSLFA